MSKEKKQPLIYERITKIVEEIPAIAKDGHNKAQDYHYRGIDAICNAVHELLSKHKLFFVPRIINKDRQVLDRFDRRTGNKIGHNVLVSIDIEYTFYCSDDMSSIVVGPVGGEGLDTGDKATPKAMSMALKYALIQLFCIPCQGEYDGDADSPEAPDNTPAQKMLDKKKGKMPVPNEMENEVYDKIVESLVDSCPKDNWPDKEKIIQAVYAMNNNHHPQKLEKAGTVAGLLAKDIKKLSKPIQGAA